MKATKVQASYTITLELSQTEAEVLQFLARRNLTIPEALKPDFPHVVSTVKNFQSLLSSALRTAGVDEQITDGGKV